MASCDERTEEHLNGVIHKNVAKKSTTPSIGVAKKSTVNSNIARKSTTKQAKPVMKVNGVHPESPNGIAKKRVRVEDEVENPAKVARTQIDYLERKQETMLATVMSCGRSESSPVHEAVGNGEVMEERGSKEKARAPAEHMASHGEEDEMSDAAVNALLGDSLEDSLDNTIDSSILDECPADKLKEACETKDTFENSSDASDTPDSELKSCSLVPAYDALNASYEAESSPDVTRETVSNKELNNSINDSSTSTINVTINNESNIISQENSVVNCDSNSPVESKAAEIDETISSNKDSETPTPSTQENPVEKLNCDELKTTTHSVEEEVSGELKSDTVPQNSNLLNASNEKVQEEVSTSLTNDDDGNVTENTSRNHSNLPEQSTDFPKEENNLEENDTIESSEEPIIPSEKAEDEGDSKFMEAKLSDEESKADVKESEVSTASSVSAEAKATDGVENVKEGGDVQQGETVKEKSNEPDEKSSKEEDVAMETSDEPVVLRTESSQPSAEVSQDDKKQVPSGAQHSVLNGVSPSEVLIIEDNEPGNDDLRSMGSVSAKSVSNKVQKEQEEGEVPLSSLVMRKNRLDQVIGRLGVPATANGAVRPNKDGVITMRAQDLEKFVVQTMQNYFQKNHNRVVAGLQKQIAVLNQSNDRLQEKASRLQHRLNEMAHARAAEKSTESQNKGVQVTESKIQAGIKRVGKSTGPTPAPAVKTPTAVPSPSQPKAAPQSPTVVGTLVSPPAASGGVPLAGGTITLMPSVLPPASANIAASQIRFSSHQTASTATPSSTVTAVGSKRVIDLTDEGPRKKTPTKPQQQQAFLVSTSGAPLLLQSVGSSMLYNTSSSGTILVPQQSVQSVVPSTATATTSSGARPPPLTPAPNLIQTVTRKAPSTDNASQHPAPFPAMPSHRTGPGWKSVPPRPGLKISRVEQGIVLSWNMGLSNDVADIVNYQLFAYQETNAAPLSSLWKKVGDVKALPLPMACTLTQFQEGNKYHFSVRAVDKHGRPGPFSDANTIRL